MRWRWKAAPPQMITVRPGRAVEVVLEIECETDMPPITWDSSRIGEAKLTVDAKDARRACINIAPEQRGSFRISYRIGGDAPAIGIIHLRVSPLSQSPLAVVPAFELDSTSNQPVIWSGEKENSIDPQSLYPIYPDTLNMPDPELSPHTNNLNMPNPELSPHTNNLNMPNPELSPHTNNLNMPNPELSPHTNNLNIPNPELSPHTKQRHWQRVNRKIPNTPEPAPSTEVSFEHEAVCENTPILRNNEALEDKTTAKPFLLQQESNLPAGRYVVEVLSEGKSIETLRTMLVMNRLVTVGRYSSTHERPLDIDLSGHFGVRGEESLCSRRQAEIYWSQGMIVIRNLGANPLRRYIPGGGRQTIGILHIWQPGELVEVPGGLFLRLLREEET